MYQIEVTRLQKILGKFFKKNKKLSIREEEVYQKIKNSVIKLLEHHAEIAKCAEDRYARSRREPTPKNGNWIFRNLYDELVKNNELLIDKELFVKNISTVVSLMLAKENGKPQIKIRFPN